MLYIYDICYMYIYVYITLLSETLCHSINKVG